MYKLPDEKDKLNTNNGTEYMFITPKTVTKGWTVSKYLITGAESIPAITLKPLYDNISVS